MSRSFSEGSLQPPTLLALKPKSEYLHKSKSVFCFLHSLVLYIDLTEDKLLMELQGLSHRVFQPWKYRKDGKEKI